MLVSRIMRRPVTTVTPDTSVRAAAALMKELGIGVLPVCENGQPIGIVTDRDIVVRWVPTITVDCAIASLMTRDVVTCRADQTVKHAAHLLADLQIRRLVVVDDLGKIAGMITLGDIANDTSEELAGQTLGEIVEQR